VAFFIAVFVNGRLMKRLYDVTRRYKRLSDEHETVLKDYATMANIRSRISDNPLVKYCSLNEAPDFYITHPYIFGWRVYACFKDVPIEVVVKDFATDDEAYNKMAAEELLEKLNEKV
jgi:uncharacterized protein YbaA (DUF1428 family)